jgi:hypothetical protein
MSPEWERVSAAGWDKELVDQWVEVWERGSDARLDICTDLVDTHTQD